MTVELLKKYKKIVEDAAMPYELWVNGKPASKYPNQDLAVIDAKMLKSKFPDAKIEIRKTSETYTTLDIPQR